MKPLRLEFGPPAPAAPWWAVGLFVIAVAVCAAAVWRLGSTQAALAEAQRESAQKRDLLQMRTPVRAAAPPYMLAPEQVAAVNRAVAALNLPWDNLFGAVEAARPEKVALLNLEPDGVRRSLRLVAEARDSADMLAFVDRLAARPELATVNLVKHEIQEKDAQRPLRFQVDAQWKEAP